MKQIPEYENEPIRICMLGGFSVEVGNRLIVSTDAGGQVWNLLEYLICNRHKLIAQEQLIEALWNEEVEDPAAALKNLVYRLRKAFSDAGVPFAKQLILSAGGVYRWNNDLPCEVDIEQYEAACRAAQEETNREKRIPLIRRAVNLYTGDFLPGAYHRVWVTPINRYYHSLYFKQVTALLRDDKETQAWDEMLMVATNALEIDRFEEEVHCHLLTALSALGRPTQAIKHYHFVSDLFYREMGAELSPRLRQMFSEIVKTAKSSCANLELLKAEFKEEETVGPYYCEYEVFKSLYRVKARAAQREGSAVLVALLTLRSTDPTPMGDNLRHQAMKSLYGAVKSSLRMGDVYSRCTDCQYIVMLPRISLENGEPVLNRILRRYSATLSSYRVQLTYSLQPIDPTQSRPSRI